MNSKEIILRLNYFRNEKKISARELSLMVGKSGNYINKLESYGFNLPVGVLMDILAALEVEPAEFFAENYKSFKQDEELYNLIHSMKENKKQTLIAFLKSEK